MLSLASSWLQHNTYSFNWLSTIFTEFHAFTKVGDTWKEANCTYCTCNHDYEVKCETTRCTTTTPSGTPSTTPSATPSPTEPAHCVDMNGTRYEVSKFQI